MEYLPFIMPDVGVSSLLHSRCRFIIFMDGKPKPSLPIDYYYHKTSSARGKDEPNPVLWQALSCLLITCVVGVVTAREPLMVKLCVECGVVETLGIFFHADFPLAENSLLTISVVCTFPLPKSTT